MSACMILYSTPLPVIDGEPSTSPQARQMVVDTINRWTPADDPTSVEAVLYALNDVDGWGGVDAVDEYSDVLDDPEHPLHAATVARIREALLAALDNVWELDPGKYSNDEVALFGDRIVSGGLSWGDAPTDACNSLALLDEAGVTDLKVMTPEGVEATRREETANAVATIFGQLKGRQCDRFAGLAVDAGLVAVCPECGWHISLDMTADMCEGCGHPGPHEPRN